MILFASFIIGYFYCMILSFASSKPWAAFISYLLIVVNFFFFIKTMFGDPGIKQSIYDHYIKHSHAPKREIDPELGTATETELNPDEEGGENLLHINNSARQRRARPSTAPSC